MIYEVRQNYEGKFYYQILGDTIGPFDTENEARDKGVAALKLVEEKFTSLTGSQKLPTFEKVNEARFECSDPMLESVTKKQLRAVYDLICRQRRNEIEFFNRQQTKAKK